MKEEFKGSDASGSDGETNRIITLSNLNTTQSEGFYVYVDGLFKSSNDYSVNHKNSDTEITFDIKIWDDQEIAVIYETTSTVSAGIIIPKNVWDFLNSYSEIRGETAGTSLSTASATYSLNNRYLIQGSEIVYTDGGVASADKWDYDEGKVTIAADSGSEITVDYNYGFIPNSVVSDFVSQAEDKIESIARRKFLKQNREEYLDVEKGQKTFFLKYYPVISSSVAINQSAVTSTPDWKTLSSGLGNDYLMDSEDKSIGRLRFIDNFPTKGKNKIKVDYTYGYSSSSIPSVVKELATLECARKILDSTIYNAYVDGKEGFSPARIEQIDNRIKELRNLVKKENISLV